MRNNRFDVGDKVKVTEYANAAYNNAEFVGTVGTVVGIELSSRWPYRVRFADTSTESFFFNELELAQ
jgi:hypothetical protein